MPLLTCHRRQAGAGFPVASAAAFVAFAPVAGAGLVYDLRFSDGTDTRPAVVGAHAVELWGRVTGADTDHANDALRTNYVVLQSTQMGGGAFGGDASDNGILPGGGARTAPFSQSGQLGSAQDLNADGVGDYGSASASSNDVAYMIARASAPTAGGTTTANARAVGTNTWEWKVATFTVTVTDVLAAPGSGAQTQIAVVRPAFSTTGVEADAYAVYYDDAAVDGEGNFVDGSQSLVTDQNLAGVYGDVVTFTAPIPEPTVMGGALALCAGTLLGRRRRTNVGA